MVSCEGTSCFPHHSPSLIPHFMLYIAEEAGEQINRGDIDDEDELMMRLAMTPEMTDVVAGIGILVAKFHGAQGPLRMCPLILQHQL